MCVLVSVSTFSNIRYITKNPRSLAAFSHAAETFELQTPHARR